MCLGLKIFIGGKSGKGSADERRRSAKSVRCLLIVCLLNSGMGYLLLLEKGLNDFAWLRREKKYIRG